MKKKLIWVICAILALSLIASACNTTSKDTLTLADMEKTAVALTVSAPQPTAEVTGEEANPTDPATDVLALIQSDLVFWATPGTDPVLAQNLETQLQNYGVLNHLSYEKVEQLAPSQLGEQTRLVVALASEGELREMAEARSQTPFLTISGAGIADLANVHVLNQTEVLPEQQSFLAGLLLAMTTPDYRIGVISQKDTSAGEVARDGFVTGARYFCGLCNARYTPVLYYPMTAEIEDPMQWQAAVDGLMAQSVKAVFVQPELSSPELINYLNTNGLAITGVEGQAGVETAQHIVALLSSGKIGDIIPFVDRILAGEVLGLTPIGLELSQVNEALLTPGKRVLFERFKTDLFNGEIKALPHGK